MSDQLAQRRLNLARANEIRLRRAALRRKIFDGEVSVADVLLDVPEEARTMPFGALLRCQYRWGVSRTQKFLFRHHVSEAKTVGALTERQRRLLAEKLR